MSLTLLSYNIKMGAESSFETVGDVIHSLSPDIVALQEVGMKWFWGDAGDGIQTISQKAHLPYTRFSPALAFVSGSAFGVAILSRFPIKTHQITHLFYQTDEPRVLLQTNIALSENTDLSVLTTHLSYKEDRVQQSKQIAKEIQKNQTPTVLLGDLNAEPQEGLHQKIAPGFIDAFAQVGEGEGKTFSIENPKWRLDYALVDPSLQILSCQVCEKTVSDHFPLLLEIAIP